MSSLTFDIHQFVKNLSAAGMPIEQAEVLAEAQKKLIDEQLTTKLDLKLLKHLLLVA